MDEDGDRLFGIEYSLTGEVPTAVEEESTMSEALPVQPVLLPNHPNPFNPVTWDGRDGSGFNAASGVYHAVLRDDGGRRWSRAMTLIR